MRRHVLTLIALTALVAATRAADAQPAPPRVATRVRSSPADASGAPRHGAYHPRIGWLIAGSVVTALGHGGAVLFGSTEATNAGYSPTARAASALAFVPVIGPLATMAIGFTDATWADGGEVGSLRGFFAAVLVSDAIVQLGGAGMMIAGLVLPASCSCGAGRSARHPGGVSAWSISPLAERGTVGLAMRVTHF